MCTTAVSGQDVQLVNQIKDAQNGKHFLGLCIYLHDYSMYKLQAMHASMLLLTIIVHVEGYWNQLYAVVSVFLLAIQISFLGMILCSLHS